jgi:flagellar basal body-associated protein FliL
MGGEVQHESLRSHPPADRSRLEAAAEGMKESQSLLGPEWFLVWVTIGLVIVTAALAVFTAYLYRTTKTLAIDAEETSLRQSADMARSIAAANELASAALAQADMSYRSFDVAHQQYLLAQNTAMRQLRAYPGITGAHIVLLTGSHRLRIAIKVENRTATPAYKFRHALAHRVCEPGAIEDVLEPRKRDIQWDMTPGSLSTLRDEGPITDDEITAIGAEKQLVIFAGRVDYEDAFDRPQHFEFRYRSGKFSEYYTPDMKTFLGYICSEPEPFFFHST